MPRIKPLGLIKVCPARDCHNGYANRQRSLTEYERAQVPADVLAMAKSDLQYCTDCNAVWENRGGYRKLYGFLKNDKFDRYKAY